MKAIFFVTAICLNCFLPNKVIAVQQVEMLKRDGEKNEIPLLNNRFRIDSNIDKITLLFFRKPGSAAVVLVRPDGRKYSVSDAAKNRDIEWYDELSYDIVNINNPMPGPWQAIGRILPNSRIVALGDIELKIDELPPLLFQGETVKVTGRILNDGEAIDANFFNDVVSLNLNFVSTNNDAFANFGAGREEVAVFQDNGYGLDERPRDGVFTGELKLTFSAGEWIPELYIKTPLLQRQVVQNPIIVHNPPLSYDIKLSDEKSNDHLLTITIDSSIVKPETAIIQGRIYYPNNEEQMFTIDAIASDSRQLSIKNYKWGRYSVELSIFGTNVNDREFMATPPTYKFEVDRPSIPASEVAPAKIITPDEVTTGKPVKERMPTSTIISLIVGCNTLILLLGWLLIRIFVQKKPVKFNVRLPFLKKKKASEDDVTDSGKNQVGKNGSKNDRTGEILNLSMTDD